MKIRTSLLLLLALSALLCAQAPSSLTELTRLYEEQVAASDGKRHATLARIGELKTDEAARFLIQLLDDVLADDEAIVVAALGETQQPRAFKTLVNMAESKSVNDNTRAKAIGVLGDFETPSPVPTLKVLALGCQQPWLSRLAASALESRLKSETTDDGERQKIHDAMQELAARAKPGAVRAIAIQAVDVRVSAGGGSTKEATQWRKKLRKLLRDEEDGPAVVKILQALARQAVAKDFSLVASYCTHEDSKVRGAAIEAIDVYERSPEELLSYYLHALTDEDERIRQTCYAGLRGSRDRRVLDRAMKAVLNDEADAVRRAAGELLAASGNSRAPEQLLVALTIALKAEAAATQATQGKRRQLCQSLARSLGQSVSEDNVSFLVEKLAGASDAWVRLAALNGLVESALSAADTAIIAAVGDRDQRVATAALDGIRNGGVSGSVEALVEAARTSKSRPIVLGCIEALGMLAAGSALGSEYLVEALEDPVAEVSLAAVDAVGIAAVEAAIPTLGEMLSHESWQVRSAVIGALKRMRVKACVPPLLERLPLEESKLRPEILAALVRITGQQLGTDHELWDSWWAATGETFVVPGLDELAGDGNTTSASGYYYGIPVLSKRLAFVLDISGSMGVKSKDATGAPTSRMAVAKAELTRVIEGLDRRAAFNIVVFHTDVDSWKAKLMLATKSNRKKATNFVAGLGALGGTNIYDAVERAFQDTRIDTIYLLTDGQPGAGKFTKPADIRREVASMNRVRRVTIHCVSVGTDSKLLKNLASDSGGVYVSHP